MARARNIKPNFYKNEDLAECTPMARLLFPGLWMLADREGRLENRPKRIKGEVFPFDAVDVVPLLDELERWGFIKRYSIGGFNCIQVLKFAEHQSPHGTEKDSLLPDENGNFTVHERTKNGITTGKTVTSPPSILVKEPLSNGAITGNTIAAPPSILVKEPLEPVNLLLEPVNLLFDNALNPESLILNPDSGILKEEDSSERLSRSEPADEPSGFEIPLNDGSEHAVAARTLQEWANSFPAVDVEQELRSMRAWCLANRTKRKTKRGVESFIVRWLQKAQDSPPRNFSPAGAHATPPMPTTNRQEVIETKNRQVATEWLAQTAGAEK